MKQLEIEQKTLEIYFFIKDYTNNNGFPPSIREICKHNSIKSTATAYEYLNRLQDKGLIDKSPQKKRAILLSNKPSFNSIPLVGSIKAGVPNFAEENLECYYPLPPDFQCNNGDFALRVDGESMINAGINDKDIIIVKKQDTAINGEIVVALIEDNATVKRFYKKNNKIILHPENDTMEDMIFDEVKILGVVKGLYRKF